MNIRVLFPCSLKPDGMVSRLSPLSAFLRTGRLVRNTLSTLAIFVAIVGGQAQPLTWLGGNASLPNDWNTAANWSGNATPTSANSVLAGTATAVNSSTLDLAGLTWPLASSNTVAPSGKGVITSALEFGNAGGVTAYTVQNGFLTPSGEGYLKLDAAVTVNLNASAGGNLNRFYWLLNGSTLNIGSGVSQGGGQFMVYGGSGSTATLNLNAADICDTNTWFIGCGNDSSVSTTTDSQNLTVNVNANQTLNNASLSTIFMGWTTGTNENKLVVRNGAVLNNAAGKLFMGANYSAASGTGRLVIGDATTKGYYTEGNVAQGFRLGTCTATSTGTGIVDVVNGTLTLGELQTIGLGFSGQPGAVGIINVYTNGLLDTMACYALKAGATPGNAIMNFDGGTMKIDAGSPSAQRTNLIDSSVTVNVLDGGFTFDMNGKSDTAIKAALLNGGTGVGVVTLTNSTGTGRITFKGANTYHGGTVVRAGTLALTNGGTLGSSSGSLTLAGGALDLGGLSPTVGAVSITGAPSSGQTITNGNLTGTSYTGTLATGNAIVSANLLANGGIGLTMSGAGTLSLAGTNTYTGGTFVNAGTLQIGGGGASGSVVGDIAITNDATLGFNRSDAFAYNGAISGPGNMTKSGAGALTLGGAISLSATATNTIGNTFAVNAGTVEFNSSSSCNFTNTRLQPFVFGTNSVTISGGTHVFAGTTGRRGITIGNNSGMTVSGGNVSMVQMNVANGSSGAYTQSGGTNTVNSGSTGVVLGAGGTSLTSSTLNLNGGVLIAQKLASDITWQGMATINLNGGTFRSSATESTNLFQTDGTNSLAGKVYVMAGGAVIDTAGFDATCTSALLAHPTSTGGGLTKLGAGTLVLAGPNTYTGPTLASNGALLVNGSSSSSLTTVAGGATLGGIGAIGGTVTVNNSGLLAPGSGAIGALTVGNLNLASGAKAYFRLNETNSPATNDFLLVSGTQSITASALTVTNLGPALNAGDSFRLLSQPTSGFTTVSLPTGYTWTNRLAIDGTIQVLTVVSATPSSTNIAYSISGNQMVLNWPAGQNWRLQAQTNSLATGLTTNWFNVPGATPPFTNFINPMNPTVFNRLVYP